jgi:hypothetical protein
MGRGRDDDVYYVNKIEFGEGVGSARRMREESAYQWL